MGVYRSACYQTITVKAVDGPIQATIHNQWRCLSLSSFTNGIFTERTLFYLYQLLNASMLPGNWWCLYLFVFCYFVTDVCMYVYSFIKKLAWHSL